MPYIAQDLRPPFESVVPRLVAELGADGWEKRYAAFLQGVLKRVYGDVGDTRYWRQNEALGVLSCMAMEWAARSGNSTFLCWQYEEGAVEGGELTAELAALADEVAAAVPKQDQILRAGSLNFFITVTMIAAVESHLIDPQSVPDLIMTIAYEHYKATTRPYEEGAISKNGEVFPQGFFPAK